MKKILGWVKKIFGVGGRSKKKLPFTILFRRFQKILELNNQILDLMAEMGGKLGGDYVFDRRYIELSCQHAADLVHKLIYNLNVIAPKKYSQLTDVFSRINSEIEEELAGKLVIPQTDYVMPYYLITRDFSDRCRGEERQCGGTEKFASSPHTGRFRYYHPGLPVFHGL